MGKTKKQQRELARARARFQGVTQGLALGSGAQLSTLTPPSPSMAVAGEVAPTGGTGPAFARQSGMRNFVQQLPKREKLHLTGEPRRRVVGKATSLFKDVPYFRGACLSVADYLGPVMPRPATTDVEWNALARAAWQEYLDSGLWDASGKFSFEGWQRQTQIYQDRDGDCLGVFTEDELGTPQHRMIPALGVDNPPLGEARLGGWQDGVQFGLHHKHKAWHVLGEESAPAELPLTSALRSGFVVDAARGHLFANWDGVGDVRGTTRFISAGNTVIDMQMMDAATHQLFNIASKIGLTISQDLGGATKPVAPPLEGRMAGFAVPSNQIIPEGEERASITNYVEEFMGEGPAGIELEPGEKLNLHNFERELPDMAAIRGSDFERIAMNWGLPVQTLFCLYSGVFNLTGPGVRLSLAKSRAWREKELARRENFIKRAYGRVIGWMIRTKRLPMPRKDPRWWLCETSYARDYTIDEGRDVNADMKRLQMGVTSVQELAREWGRDAVEVANEQIEWIDRIWQALKAKDLPVTTFFPSEMAVGEAAAVAAGAERSGKKPAEAPPAAKKE